MVDVGALYVLFEGAADNLAGAEADGESQGEDDTAEENSEGEFDDDATDLKVIEHHGGGEDEDEPFDAEGEETGVLELGVDGSDEHGASEEAGDDATGDEKDDAPTAWVT